MVIDLAAPKKNWVLRLALIGSVTFHVLLLAVLIALTTGAVKESYIVNMIITETPAATPEPAVEPEKPKKTPPPPNQEVKQPPNEPPKPVFGLTKDSVVDSDSAVAMRVGNTLMKEPEKELTDPNAVKPYAAPEVYSQGELDRAPKVLKMVKPEYPLLAKRAGREGVVKLRFLVTKDGQVTSIKVLSAPAGLGFEEAAVAAVKQWRFEQPTVKGRAVAAWIVQSIRFQLE
jgi:protein TonB